MNVNLDITREALLADGPALPLACSEVKIASVIAALGRRPSGYFSWPLVRVLLTGLLTAGLWPLIALHVRFRRWQTVERQQMTSAGEWLLSHTGDENAKTMIELSDRPTASGATAMIAMLVGIAIVLLLAAFQWAGWNGLSNAIFPDDFRNPLYLLLTLTLSIAFVTQMAAVNQHAVMMGEVAAAFDRITGPRGIASLRGPRMSLGLSIFAVIASITCLCLGLVWAVPMCLAATSQRRFITRNDARFRSRMADRLSELVEQGSFRSPVNRASHTWRKCEHDRCTATMPRASRFCPRCGRAVSQEAA